jgi:hypothetical protein
MIEGRERRHEIVSKYLYNLMNEEQIFAESSVWTIEDCKN